METYTIKNPRTIITKPCETYDKACEWFGELLGSAFVNGIYGKFELFDESDTLILSADTSAHN